MEEVRSFLGYRVEPEDPKFQELVAEKEKAEQKKLRDLRRKERAAQELAKMIADANKLRAEREAAAASGNAGSPAADSPAPGDTKKDS